MWPAVRRTSCARPLKPRWRQPTPSCALEQVKRIAIVDADWLPGGDELTPTMKLKRKPIQQKYASEIEQLYG